MSIYFGFISVSGLTEVVLNQLKEIEIPVDDISDRCTKLCNGSTHGETKNINAVDLNDELDVLSTNVKSKSTPVET